MDGKSEERSTPIVWDGPIIAAMPVFNEEETIGSVVLSCKPQVDEVLCVDDGSSDASSRIAQKLGATVHHHRANRGYGGALKTIFQTAVERHSKAEKLPVPLHTVSCLHSWQNDSKRLVSNKGFTCKNGVAQTKHLLLTNICKGGFLNHCFDFI